MIGIFGDLILDITVRWHGPLQTGSDVAGEISYQGGGSAANVAAWLGHLGSRVRFAGALGRDLAASILGLELQQYGVETYLVEKVQPTGAILLFLDDRGERTMVTSRGANLQLKADDLADQFFVGLKHLHLTAYSFFGSEELVTTTTRLLEKAVARGISFSVDPSSYALLERFGVQRFLSLTKEATLLFPNFEEGRVLTGEKDPESMIRKLLEHYPRVVLTLGSGGCLCGEGQAVTGVPAPKVQAVDTTGAGDAFAAGFLHEFLRESNLVAGARMGNQVASGCVQHYGGRPKPR